MLTSTSKRYPYRPLIPAIEGNGFVSLVGINLDDNLCEQYERTVGADNCVRFENKILQIPKNEYRFHYVKTKVRVHRYADGSMALFHGPRKLADYDFTGKLKTVKKVA